MEVSQIYILAGIVCLAAIALTAILKRKEHKPISKSAAAAFCFILAGLILGENGWVGCALTAIGAILAITDVFKKRGRPESYSPSKR